MNLKSLAGEIGETFYVVDSDFRTQAQGWSKGDRTGPLDLFLERNPNRVFYAGAAQSGSYATDAAAWQAAINEMVDFRGDKLQITPGSYSIGTALTLDAAGMRLVGPERGHVKCGLATVTATVDAAYTVSVDDVEIGHHTMVPLTAANFIDIASGADRGHLHHLYYNSTGVAASTSTEFVNGTTCVDWLCEHCNFYVDAAQGDAFTLTSAQRWTWQDCDFTVGLTTVAWASVFTFTTSMLGSFLRRSYFTTAGGATPAVYTNVMTGVTNVNAQIMVTDCRINGTAIGATAFETGFGTTTDVEYAENYYSGDATTEGGALMVLA